MLVYTQTHTHTPHHTQSSKSAHISHTRTLYRIVSISVTAEGLATRDCAGLSRHGPDFTGYKGSRLPLVSNSVLDKKKKKKKSFVWKKKKLLIIITEKLQQCNFEYWLASQKHRERRSCRSNYTIYNILYLLLYISWATRASLAALKNGCQKKNKAKQEETRHSSTCASYSFNKSSTRTCNQSGSTNELEQVLFGIHWLMAEPGWGIAGSDGFVQTPNNHIHSVVLNFGLFNNAFLAGSCCLS